MLQSHLGGRRKQSQEAGGGRDLGREGKEEKGNRISYGEGKKRRPECQHNGWKYANSLGWSKVGETSRKYCSPPVERQGIKWRGGVVIPQSKLWPRIVPVWKNCKNENGEDWRKVSSPMLGITSFVVVGQWVLKNLQILQATALDTLQHLIVWRRHIILS